MISVEKENFINIGGTYYEYERNISSINYNNFNGNSSNLSIYQIDHSNFKDKIKKSFEKKFINFLSFYEVSDNISSSVEYEFFNLFEENPVVTNEWLASLVLDNISNIKVLVNLLKVIEKLDINHVSDSMYLYLSSLLVNSNLEVKDCTLKVLESFATDRVINILQSATLTPDWLDEYRKGIVESLTMDS